MSPQARVRALRSRIAALETPAPAAGVLPFGDARLDRALAGGGLALGRWHEAAGEGLELETAAAAGAFVAGLATPLARRGAAVWILRRDDLYAPGLAGLGFPAERLIQVRVRTDAEALAALEEALASHGVTVAVAEVETADLTAGRRLQLACETTGATGFCLTRRPFGGPAQREQSGSANGSAAATRWRIAPAPSQPGPGEPGLGAPRWSVRLERSRGGRTGAWLIEKRQGEVSDGAFPLRVVAELGDRVRAPAPPERLAG
ncbi:MAG TPA: protein imuA [Caulobacteraceae bacterium]|jgi:protein ImuA|nr:protein imuA [Caulobacteraceae bacterium]